MNSDGNDDDGENHVVEQIRQCKGRARLVTCPKS